jgi:hypothetical protein
MRTFNAKLLSVSWLFCFVCLVWSFLTPSRGYAQECSPLYIFSGSAQDLLGYSVSGAFDFNKDGYDDMIVGASGADKAYIYSGRTGTLLCEMTGEGTGDYFGVSVASAGDINKDGYADVIVGANLNDATGTDAGRAYVFLGGQGPFPTSLSASSADFILAGEAPGVHFGVSVCGIGDVNGDSWDDFAIGASTGLGKAYVFSGQNASLLWTIIGEADGDAFGYSVSHAGDVNHDGYADLILGAPWNDANGTDAGRAYVFLGRPGPFPIVQPAADADVILTGECAMDYFGVSVSSGGDVNRDGYGDVIVGAQWSDAASTDAGRTYVFYGGNIISPAQRPASGADWIITAENRNDEFGGAVSDAGDVNCDGFADFIVGASSTGSGHAYVFYGGDFSIPHSILAVDADWKCAGDGEFGQSVSGAGDVNGDGSDDVIVGAHWYGTHEGRAYVYTMPECYGTGEQVALDIKPGSCPNPLNVNSGSAFNLDGNPDEGAVLSLKVKPGAPQPPPAVVPVAILGTEDFDVSAIVPSSVLLEGVPALRWNVEDVATPLRSDAAECECNTLGADGYVDLTLKFGRDQLIKAIGDVQQGDVIPLTISGELSDGTPFEGQDCMVIVGGQSGPQAASSAGVMNSYPNPFNPTTTIAYSVFQAGQVALEIYNVLGEKVRTLVDQFQTAGDYEVIWDSRSDHGEAVSSGIYFYRLRAGDLNETKKMVLMK